MDSRGSGEPTVELQLIEREEHDARLRLAEAREKQTLSDGVVPKEHHELLHQLEEDWKRAVERLHRARNAGKS